MAKKILSWIVICLGVTYGGFVTALFVAYVIFEQKGVLFIAWEEHRVLSFVATIAILSILPASLAAMRNRRRAGQWLIAVGSYIAIAGSYALLNRSEIVEAFSLGASITLYGLFFWITGRLGWGELRK